MGKIVSEETKKKMRISALGRKNSPESTKKRLETNSLKYKDKIICPHCNKEGSLFGMKRWHFDNCKFRDLTHL